MSNKVVQQCRGIILDESDNWRVISRPYDKFFNYEEGNADSIDWSTARVFEKLDGSLITLYWYDHKWNVSTSGTPDASAEVNGTGKSFAQLFWEVWNELGLKLPDKTNICYMFELMTPFNRVVVRHEKNRIVHHGARYTNAEMEELLPYFGESLYGWEIAKTYPLDNIESITSAAKKLDPIESEGYVVIDHSFNRVKVKSPAYVAMHHLISNMSKRKLLELIRCGETSEVLSYYPEWRPAYEEIQNKLGGLVKEAEEYYSRIQQIEDKKSFALEAIKYRHSGALFSVKQGKVKSFQEYFTTVNLRTLEELLGIKENAGIESSHCS